LRFIGTATLIKMHKAPFYQTGCEDFARDIGYPFSCFWAGFFSFRQRSKKRSKRRPPFFMAFILIV